jgi:hypothetical protein
MHSSHNNGVADLEIDAFITSLKAACSENTLKTMEGIKQCHDKCRPHLCCFTSDPSLAGVGSCENVQEEVCAAYAPCKRLVTPPGDSPAASPSSSPPLVQAKKVLKACELPQDVRAINESWVSGCHDACASRLCCLLFVSWFLLAGFVCSALWEC